MAMTLPSKISSLWKKMCFRPWGSSRSTSRPSLPQRAFISLSKETLENGNMMKVNIFQVFSRSILAFSFLLTNPGAKVSTVQISAANSGHHEALLRALGFSHRAINVNVIQIKPKSKVQEYNRTIGSERSQVL